MHKYLFILGRNQELSSAELSAVLKSDKFEIGEGFLVYEAKEELDAKKLMDRLGGTIKLAKVFSDKVKEQEILMHLVKESARDKKIYFGFSQYGVSQNINSLANDIKKDLKAIGHPSRWVVSKENQLSSVVVKKNKLLSQGAEIIITKGWVAQTLAVQDFEEYSRRDYGRPVRDMVSGSMPPKLAKIMINLAQLAQKDKILDPFCGSGTILQEALLLGYINVIGSDISPKAIEDTKKNMEWLGTQGRQGPLTSPKQDRVKGPDLPTLYNLDVRKLSSKIGQVKAIVTEPYLGPPLKGRENSSQISKIIFDLEKLYLDAFTEFYKILSQGGKIVIVFPVINSQHLKILPQIKKLGFDLAGPDNLIYSRPEQNVKRNILVFQKS